MNPIRTAFITPLFVHLALTSFSTSSLHNNIIFAGIDRFERSSNFSKFFERHFVGLKRPISGEMMLMMLDHVSRSCWIVLVVFDVSHTCELVIKGLHGV